MYEEDKVYAEFTVRFDDSMMFSDFYTTLAIIQGAGQIVQDRLISRQPAQLLVRIGPDHPFEVGRQYMELLQELGTYSAVVDDPELFDTGLEALTPWASRTI